MPLTSLRCRQRAGDASTGTHSIEAASTPPSLVNEMPSHVNNPHSLVNNPPSLVNNPPSLVNNRQTIMPPAMTKDVMVTLHGRSRPQNVRAPPTCAHVRAVPGSTCAHAHGATCARSARRRRKPSPWTKYTGCPSVLRSTHSRVEMWHVGAVRFPASVPPGAPTVAASAYGTGAR